MISKEEYKKTLIRMWDSMRDDVFKEESCCTDISCSECPINFGCGSVMHYYEVVKFVEKWAKEHPIVTNGDKFLKNYPKAEIYNYDDEFIFVRLDSAENHIKIPRTWWESEVDDND